VEHIKTNINELLGIDVSELATLTDLEHYVKKTELPKIDLSDCLKKSEVIDTANTNIKIGGNVKTGLTNNIIIGNGSIASPSLLNGGSITIGNNITNGIPGGIIIGSGISATGGSPNTVRIGTEINTMFYFGTMFMSNYSDYILFNKRLRNAYTLTEATANDYITKSEVDTLIDAVPETDLSDCLKKSEVINSTDKNLKLGGIIDSGSINNIVIGTGSSAFYNDNIVIGNNVNFYGNNSIGIGSGISVTTIDTVRIGSNQHKQFHLGPVTMLYNSTLNHVTFDKRLSSASSLVGATANQYVTKSEVDTLISEIPETDLSDCLKKSEVIDDTNTNTKIGGQVSSGKTNNVVIGKGAVSSANNNITIGNNVTNTGTSSIVIGSGFTFAANNCVKIGTGSQSVFYFGSIIMGYNVDYITFNKRLSATSALTGATANQYVTKSEVDTLISAIPEPDLSDYVPYSEVYFPDPPEGIGYVDPNAEKIASKGYVDWAIRQLSSSV
jgi:hypothetical protein